MAGAAHTLAVLAGGAATRLGGRDKGLETLEGRPLIDWVLRVASLRQTDAGAPAPVLIVANRHLDAYRFYGETISDALPGHRGPLAGIAAALAACRTPWLLTVPVDCPLPPPDLAARLLAQPASGAAGTAWVAHDGERRQPLFALYARGLAESAAAAAAGEAGVHAWQDAAGAIEVDFADRRVHFENLNTMPDFLTFRERLGSNA